MHYKRVSAYGYDSVIEKVQNKLSSWKAKVLSPVGRLVLIQPTMAFVPTYYMQCCMLPSIIHP